ncbi:hypothetical protein PENSPDRAFT_647152 [Peniophora sp. CONT]|nr:hypothetical protein PENSPDRAFT_647152 [Peniophora sp. CONT]
MLLRASCSSAADICAVCNRVLSTPYRLESGFASRRPIRRKVTTGRVADCARLVGTPRLRFAPLLISAGVSIVADVAHGLVYP